MTYVLALAVSIGMAAVISEGAFRDTLTTRGRFVLPVVLGIFAWLLTLAVGVLRMWLAT